MLRVLQRFIKSLVSQLAGYKVRLGRYLKVVLETMDRYLDKFFFLKNGFACELVKQVVFAVYVHDTVFEMKFPFVFVASDLRLNE